VGQLSTRGEACAWITIKPQPRKRGPLSARGQSGLSLGLKSKARSAKAGGLRPPAAREPLPQQPKKAPRYEPCAGLFDFRNVTELPPAVALAVFEVMS
jgi:hypothetical protein